MTSTRLAGSVHDRWYRYSTTDLHDIQDQRDTLGLFQDFASCVGLDGAVMRNAVLGSFDMGLWSFLRACGMRLL